LNPALVEDRRETGFLKMIKRDFRYGLCCCASQGIHRVFGIRMLETNVRNRGGVFEHRIHDAEIESLMVPSGALGRSAGEWDNEAGAGK
jgi:hypothetical protein